MLCVPQSEAAAKRVGVVARATLRRQCLENLDVTTADYRVVGLKRGDHEVDDVEDVTAPFLLTMTFQRSTTNVILICVLPVRKVSKLHRLDDAFNDHCATEASAEGGAKETNVPFGK
jgi:hypothetical protein